MERNSYLLGQESREQKIDDFDFMYQQIKKLSDKLDTYFDATGDSEQSGSMLGDFIIEKSKTNGFLIFQNDDISVSILNYAGESDKPLILGIKQNLIEEEQGHTSRILGTKLNVVDIQNLVTDILDNIKQVKLAIKYGFDIDKQNIFKRISFREGAEEIIFLRTEILNLSKKDNTINIETINPNKYIINYNNINLEISIDSGKLFIKGKLNNIKEIQEFIPIIEDIITKHKKILGIKKNNITNIKKALLIKEKSKSFQEEIDKELKRNLKYSNKQTNFLIQFKSKLETGFLGDLEMYDDDIKEDIKDICIALINEILELSEKTTLADSKQTTYIAYLTRIFLDATNRHNLINNNLTIFYGYILNKENLKKKYGEKLKKKILENIEDNNLLISKIFSFGPNKYCKNRKYNSVLEKQHNMMFSEDNMMLFSTSTDQSLLICNLISGNPHTIIYNNNYNHKDMSQNMRYLLSAHTTPVLSLFGYGEGYTITDMKENKKIKLKEIFSNYDWKCHHILHDKYVIYMASNDYRKRFAVYDIETKSIYKPEIHINNKLYCISQNKIFFFELADYSQDLILSIYDMEHNDSILINNLFEYGEYPIDMYSTDNHLYIILSDRNNQTIIKRFNLDEKVITDNVSDYNITHLQQAFQKDHIHISNNGYCMLQTNDSIHIFHIDDTHNIYTIKSPFPLNHIFKVEFVNSPQYGHFAICRDGNHIYKIDIGLIKELIPAQSGLETNKNQTPKKEDDIENTEEILEDKIKTMVTEESSLDKSETTNDSPSYNKILSKFKEIERRDGIIIRELKETKAQNAKILEELLKTNKLNESLTETVEQLQMALEAAY